MLTDLSDQEFAALRDALALAQEIGEASAPGEISYMELALHFQTTPQDIRIHEQAALEKMRSHPLFRDNPFLS